MSIDPVYFEREVVVGRLRVMVRAVGSIRKVADSLGVSNTYVQGVLSGNLTLGPKILKALGFKRVVVYVSADEYRAKRKGNR